MLRHRLLRFLGLSAVLLAIAVPARADDSVVLDGGVSHLPSLGATGTYFAGASMGAPIRAYRASGAYVSQRTAIARRAQSFLDTWLRDDCRQRERCRPAIVFDMDDTLVSWYSVFDALDFTPDSSVTTPILDACQTPRITSTMNLLQHAQAKDVKVYVITGRTESQRQVTASCLEQIGAGQVTLILRQPDEQSLTATTYKSAARARIEKEGWTIGLSIGDQVSDVAGGHTAGQFVVPNPVYFIP